LIPHAGSDYAGLRDEMLNVGANRHAANKACKALTKEAHRLGRNLIRQNVGSGKKKALLIKKDDAHHEISYGGTSLRINNTHLEKLKILYEKNYEELRVKKSQFNDFLFCIMLRYDSLDGGGFQVS